MKARDLIKPNEKVIVIFTRDENSWAIDHNQTGYSASWVMDAERMIDRVILYVRDDNDQNTVYIGTYAGCEAMPKEEEKRQRYTVHFKHMQYVGQTSLNWKEFAEADANPIRYLP